jgi:hypothetical protein
MINPGISRESISRFVRNFPGHMRNKPCHCGSELKWKKCCLPKDQGLVQRKYTIDGKEAIRWAVPTMNDILMTGMSPKQHE